MDIFVNNGSAPAPAPSPVPMQGMPYGYGPMGAPYGYGPMMHHGPGPLLPLLLIAGAVFFFKRRRFMAAGRPSWAGPGGAHDMREKFRRGRHPFFGDGALEMARERYAKGEMNAEEYEALRRHLSGEEEKGDLRI